MRTSASQARKDAAKLEQYLRAANLFFRTEVPLQGWSLPTRLVWGPMGQTGWFLHVTDPYRRPRRMERVANAVMSRLVARALPELLEAITAKAADALS